MATIKDNKNKKVSLKDDFYEAINYEWIQKAKIPADRGSTGSFYEMAIKNEKALMKETTELIEKLNVKNAIQDNTILNYVEFANMTRDFEKREELGVKPLVPYLKRILEIRNLNDLLEKYEYLFNRGYPLPFEFGIGQDFKNSDDQILMFAGPELIFPEKSYYDDANPMKPILLTAFRKMSEKLLSFYFDDKDKNQNIINEALNFEFSLVEYSASALEMSNYISLYNPYDYDKFLKSSKNINYKPILEKLVNKQTIEKINVYYLKFADNIDKLVNEDNFKNIKSWMFLKMIIRYSSALNEESRLIVSEFNRVISGQAKPSSKQKAAFYLAYNKFNIPFGTYYAKERFSEKAKKDVEEMIQKMINIYKDRLFNNDWLSSATKIKAIEKLSALGVHVGYPTEIQSYYSSYKIKNYKKGGNIISNLIDMNMTFAKYEMAKYKQSVNKNLWGMSPAEVNAYFNPFMNHIVFPAAILDKPFYSIKQSESANYGGIGAVIAHEISHAFDNNGAQFDEKGNLNSWWTKEDFKTFNQKAQAMVELFDNKETEFGKCNGKLTVSENIADAGGISCALEAARANKDFNAVDFFNNWAEIWRGKFKKETAQMLLLSDVHAPVKLRANLQVQNLDLFYETYDIKSSDKMWLPKAKRVKIW